jgi:hypothetical protein
MTTLSCHCGQVQIDVAKTPDHINACNCSLCRKAGAQWAYFHPSEVTVAGGTSGYCRRDKADAAAQVHFCPICGATTHFTLTDSAVAKFGNSMMGANLAVADDSALAGIERRFPDGRAWSGEGPFVYVRAAEIIGAAPAGD